MSSPLRDILTGLLLPVSFGVPLAAPLLQFVPDSPFLGTLARMLENAAPQLIVAAMAPALLLWLLGARRLALAGLAFCALGLAGLAVQHQTISQPPGAATGQPDLRLIWFNALFVNRTPPATILDAIAGSGADVVLLAETARLGPHLDRLDAIYPYRLGCTTSCEVALLSRHPITLRTVLGPGIAWPERMLVAELRKPGQPPVTLVGLHMVKPWFYGITETETIVARRELRRHRGPLVLAGDLNSAPWSRRLRLMHEQSGLRLPRAVVPTWPAAAGPLGVPIDHVLTRGGAVVRSLTPWGADLGSDHRGLLAEIDLPPA